MRNKFIDHSKAELRQYTGKQKAQYRESLVHFSRAIEHSVTFAGPYRHRAYSYLKLGEWDKAIADADYAIKLTSRTPWTHGDLHLARGCAYIGKGELDKALDSFELAIRCDDTHAESYACRGAVSRLQGKMALAVKDYTIAVDLAPEAPEYYSGRGYAYAEQGLKELAAADLMIAGQIYMDLSADGDDPRIHRFTFPLDGHRKPFKPPRPTGGGEGV